jgi:hypothetical protein
MDFFLAVGFAPDFVTQAESSKKTSLGPFVGMFRAGGFEIFGV